MGQRKPPPTEPGVTLPIKLATPHGTHPITSGIVLLELCEERGVLSPEDLARFHGVLEHAGGRATVLNGWPAMSVWWNAMLGLSGSDREVLLRILGRERMAYHAIWRAIPYARDDRRWRHDPVAIAKSVAATKIRNHLLRKEYKTRPPKEPDLLAAVAALKDLTLETAELHRRLARNASLPFEERMEREPLYVLRTATAIAQAKVVEVVDSVFTETRIYDNLSNAARSGPP